MKVNLGCGQFPIRGWVNVDLACPADIQGDFRLVDFAGVEEVLMSHALEHVPWPDVFPLVEKIHRWMVPGGIFRVEVPDMREIMRRGEEDQLWMPYIYGSQQHIGEAHMSGYTESTLVKLLEDAGWTLDYARPFLSEHPFRLMMPCLEAVARP